MNRPPRILVFAEAVTLAHVSRPLAFIDTLDPTQYELHFACAFRYETYFNYERCTYWPIESISYDAFISSSSGNKSAYDDEQLASYLAEEDALIREIQPDLIVNDTRFTLCISAPSAGIPLVNINNSYWSPYRTNRVFPIPAYKRSALFNVFPPHIAERLLPYELIERTYPFVQPFFERKFLAPFNRARQRRGLAPLPGFDALHTFGDWTLYCDIPDFIPLADLPANHRFLGPLLWSPPHASALPVTDPARPTLYVSLGSSNDVPQCREIVAALAELDVQLLVATAGRFSLPSSDRGHVEEFLPGLEASRAATLVVCSGGSTAAYQALSVGTPVMGLPANSDQFLAMEAIERWGAGLSLRADQTTVVEVVATVVKMLAEPQFKARAVALAQGFSAYDARQRFGQFIQEILPPSVNITDSSRRLQTLPERLQRRAERSPELPAFWGLESRKRGEAAQTYGQVWAQVQTLALALRAQGLEHGERVGFLAAVDPAWELLHLAVLLAGGVVVGLDLHDAPERVRIAARQSDIRAWVVQNATIVEDWSSLFSDDTLFIILLTDHPVTKPRGKIIPLHHLLNDSVADLSKLSWPRANDLATIIFTSGTTGEAKGIPYTHRQLTHAVRAIARAYRDLPEGFQSLCWLPLSNLFQRMVNLCAIERGAVINFIAHPSQLLESLPIVQPELLIGVPRFYEKLEAGIRTALAAKPWAVRALFRCSQSVGAAYRTCQQRGNPLRFLFWPLYWVLDVIVLKAVRRQFGGRLRYLVSGAAPLNPKTMEFFWGIGLLTLEAYGTSENAIPIAMNRPHVFSFGTTGRPLLPNEVEIGPNQEVLVKGPSLFAGYWKQERDAALFQGAYYRTGDEGQWERGGFLKLLGRRSDFIKTSTGRRLAPSPIEQHFKELPFVDQAVIFGHQRKGPALLVTVDMKALDNTTSGELTTPLQQQIIKALQGQASGLTPLSQPLGILVFNRAFSVLKGEMTANLKLRRRVIEENYRVVLDALYQESENAPNHPVWFFTSADVRMQEFNNLPKLNRLQIHLLSRWLVLGLFFLHALRAYVAYARGLFHKPWDYKKLQSQLLSVLVRHFRATVGPLKGPLIKIGQTLSYVDVGLPPAIQQFLKELQYKSPPLSSKRIRTVIRSSLGKDPDELFAEWHDVPLASASISQIHLARLKDGQRVCVKVRYPGIERIVKSDLFAVRMLLPLLAGMLGVQNVRENFNEARRLFLGECDLRAEANFMRRFQAIFAGHPHIIIPAVYPEYCSEDVLTMEYVEGQNYAEFKATATRPEIDQAAETITEMIVASSLAHGIFQADPHPGNYLFKNSQVCFLDFGFCKEWPPEFIRQWRRQTLAVIQNDVTTFADATEKIGLRGEEVQLDYAALLQCYRHSIHKMFLENRPFEFTPEVVKKITDDFQNQYSRLNRIYSSPELLAQGRLFWGYFSLLADMGATVNSFRIHMQYLLQD
ncbi:AarF/UbiB family protein [Propionivibrio sp.]|uniref:AarF/UbiB family protein n=1 Tax=Propionivibrio sp. TaxID=2212460 RepID=UPI00260A1001|nr:AarF/UbiB family protein [Propionivibrio sp.]